MKKDWMVKESELDEYQIKALMATLDKSCIVTGCAGSGKSVLALIKAQRIQKERGDNYKIIVYTKALCRYMNSGRSELGLHNSFSYYEEWKWKRTPKFYANGGMYMVYARDEYNNKIPNKPSADYIIVDEIQDFTEDEIKEFIEATNKHFFFFGDTAQSIYGNWKITMPIDAIGYLLPMNEKPKGYDLYYNYRLPLSVAKIVQYVGVDLPPFDESIYKSPEIAIPYILRYDNLAEQISAIKEIIKRKDLSDVAILLPTGEMVKKIGSTLLDLGINVELKYNDNEDFRSSKDTLDFSSSNPKVMTYHSAKGLQFETIFLPGLENFDDSGEAQRKALYVAMTRTYKDLYMMYSDFLPDPLSQIPHDLYKTSEIETIEDI